MVGRGEPRLTLVREHQLAARRLRHQVLTPAMHLSQLGLQLVALLRRRSLSALGRGRHRRDPLLELVDLSSGNVSVYSTHKGAGEILEFFFTDVALPGVADAVVITTRAVEVLVYAAGYA